jgi:hypothetical protein
MSALAVGRRVFLNSNGMPLAAGQVYVYNYGTLTLATIYQDINETVSQQNPMQLDAAGTALVFGTGTFTFVAFDMLGNPVPGASSPAQGLVSPVMLPVTQASSIAAAVAALGLGGVGSGFPIKQQSITGNNAIGLAYQGNLLIVASASSTQTLVAASNYPGLVVGFYAASQFTLASAGGSITGDTVNTTSLTVFANTWIAVISDGTFWRIWSASPELLQYQRAIASSAANPGYLIIPGNGGGASTIINYGSATTGGGGSVTVTYAQPFSTGVLSIQATIGGVAPGTYTVVFGTETLTTQLFETFSGGSLAGGILFDWLAIGT